MAACKLEVSLSCDLREALLGHHKALLRVGANGTAQLCNNELRPDRLAVRSWLKWETGG